MMWFTAEILALFSTDPEKTPKIIRSKSGALGRLIELMKNHFYVNKEKLQKSSIAALHSWNQSILYY